MTGGARGTRSVEAYWAEFSKLPGDGNDYRVLRGHGGPSNYAYYGSEIVANLPGTASSRSAGASLPWFVLGHVADDDEHWTAGAVLEETGYADASSRPVSRLRYVNALFADLRGAPGEAPGYVQLGEALAPYRELAEDELAPLRIRPADWRAVASTVQAYGFEWCAAVAATVLSGARPIVITGGQRLSWQHRLECLDAVIGLLPYGARATLSVATYADSAGSHAIRLYFGDYAPRGGVEVRLGDPAPPLPAAPDALAAPAQAYLRRLEEFREAMRSAGVEDPVPELLATLARMGRPIQVTDPEAALEALEECSRPVTDLVLWQRGREAGARLGDRVRAGDPGPPPRPAAQRTLFDLFRRTPAQDLPPVTRLAAVGLRWSREDAERICDVVAATVGGGDGVALAAGYAAQARAEGDLDLLLAGLLARLDLTLPSAADALVDLLAALRPAATEPLPCWRRALWADRAATVGLLHAQLRRYSAVAGDAASVRAAVAVLLGVLGDRDPRAPEWLQVLSEVGGSGRPVTVPADVAGLLQEPAYPRLVVALGDVAGQAGPVVRWLYRAVAAGGGGGPLIVGSGGVATAIRAWAPSRLTAADAAHLDVLRLWHGDAPEALLDGGTGPLVEAVAVELATLAQDPQVSPLLRAVWCRELFRHVGQVPGALLRLVDMGPAFRADVMSWLVQHPESRSGWSLDPPSREQCAWMWETVEGPGGQAAVCRLAALARIEADARAGDDVRQVIGLCREALACRVPPAQVGRALGVAPWAPELLAEVLLKVSPTLFAQLVRASGRPDLLALVTSDALAALDELDARSAAIRAELQSMGERERRKLKRFRRFVRGRLPDTRTVGRARSDHDGTPG